MTKPEFPGPKRGDKLFVEEADLQERAFHLASYLTPRHQNAEAFKVAADFVIQRLEQVERIDYRDDLLHPVAYLYRHSLELKLKEVVMYGIQLHCYKKADVEEILGEHNLAKLWTKAKVAIFERWPNRDEAPVKSVEAVVNEMHQTDKDGQKWRYQTDKDGRPNRPEKLPEFVSLKSLCKTMDNVFSFLNGCTDGIDDSIQAMRGAMY